MVSISRILAEQLRFSLGNKLYVTEEGEGSRRGEEMRGRGGVDCARLVSWLRVQILVWQDVVRACVRA